MAERVIGVDVGGTKVAVALLEGANLHHRGTRPTARDAAGLIDQLVETVRAAGAAAAVGIAVPSTVDWDTGSVRSSVNVPLKDVALRRVLRERLGVPVFVDNDATCAALAEAYDDGGEPVARHLVMFTVGTGVGGGIVVDGRIYRGATGAAAELGHMIIAADVSRTPFPHADRFPQPGSLEALASGRALDALGRERGFADGPAVVEAARAGNEKAREAMDVVGARLGLGIANAINTFDPDVVVVGGGVSSAGELLLAPARRTAARYVVPGAGTATDIRLARYGPEAGVRGAALLAAQELAIERAGGPPVAPAPAEEMTG
jgi:glucokinase